MSAVIAAVSTGGEDYGQLVGWIVAVNVAISAGVLCLAYGLSRCRSQLQQLTRWLEQAAIAHDAQSAGYVLTYRRLQIVQTRWNLAQLQLRSRQAKQIWQLVQWIRLLLLLQSGRLFSSRKNRRKNR